MCVTRVKNDRDRGNRVVPWNQRGTDIQCERRRRKIEIAIYDTVRERRKRRKNCARKPVGGGATYILNKERRLDEDSLISSMLERQRKGATSV